MGEYEDMKSKGLKCTLNYVLSLERELLYHWYLTPDKSSKICKGFASICWKGNQLEGTFHHFWWTHKKAKKYLDQMCILI